MEGIREVPRVHRSAQRKEEMLDRIAELTQRDFIARSVYPFVPECSSEMPDALGCETEVLSNRGRGRAVIRYGFDDGQTIIGKVYSDDLGIHCYDVLTGLSKDGFGDDGPHRVPRPLAYLPKHNVVLMTEARGSSLKSLVEEDETVDSERRASLMKQAARWLVALHSSPCRVGQAQTLCESVDIFKALRLHAKASVDIPRHERERLIPMIKTLCTLGKDCERRTPLVQTHGRYHLEEIFFDGGTVTSVDFDGSVPSDPAKDLAKFLSVSAKRTFKRTGNMEDARIVPRMFLKEYLFHLPDHAANLAFYWGTFLLQDLLDELTRYEVYANGRKQDRFEFYKSRLEFQAKELDAVMEGDWQLPA